MKIKINYFENIIELNINDINVIEVENKKYFYRLVSNLYSIINNGYCDDIIFTDNENNELNISNKLKIFTNFFDLDFDSKKYSNDINKFINDSIDDENKNDLNNLYNKIIKNYNKIFNDIDIPLSIENEFNIENITKLMKISINKKDELLDNLLLLIDLEKVLKTNNILIFINLKQYLTKEELEELYKYSLYNEVKIILIDSQSYGVTLNNEKKLIIDENLDEFML